MTQVRPAGDKPPAPPAWLTVPLSVTSTWERPITAGVVPSDRYAHTCVGVGSRLVLFGGFCQESQDHLNDVHLLDTGTCLLGALAWCWCWSWSCLAGCRSLAWPSEFVQAFAPTIDPDGKAGTTVHKMLMWYRPETSGNAPCARAGHTANVVGNQVLS